MKIAILVMMLSVSVKAQTPKPAQLSTADRIAITQLENVKQTAQKQYMDAQTQESAIMAEFAGAHPGYHLDAQYNVIADVKPEAKKTEAAPKK